MAVTYGAFDSLIEEKVAAFLRAKPGYQQFGQSNDGAVFDGRTACTHVVWQTIARIVTGKHYTLDQINTYAGMPYQAKASNGLPRGMRPNEVATLIARLRLPYKIVYDQSWTYLRGKAKLGPVMYAMRYGNAPEWKGETYNGVRASAPFAIKGGKTQLTGFEDGPHAVLLAACRKATIDGKASNVAYRKEPNHGSGSRPEKPAYDIITTAQASAEYNAYKSRLGRRLYAVVPTKAIPTTHI